MTVRRAPALLAIAGLLVLAGVANRGHGARQADNRDRGRVRLDQPIAAPMAVAAPSGALSSTWYCAGGTAAKGSDANTVVVVVNPGSRALDAEITVISDSGRSRTRQVTVPPHSRVRTELRAILTARYAAALIEVRGGGVAVEREATGPVGYSAAPCASNSSDRWYLAAGSTLRGADEYLALFNPYPDDTSVDMTFATEQGPRSPRRLQAFPVPGRSLRVVHLNSSRVNRHSPLAVQIVARSGRLVVDRLQVFNGSGDALGSPTGGGLRTAAPRGLNVSTAVARPADWWVFPAGRKFRGAREQVVVFNPSGRDAAVDVGVVLDSPRRNGELDPFPMSIPPHDVKVLDLTDQDTMPDDVDHSITVRSRNGVPVVAEQILMSGDPSERVGATMGAGSTLEAARWLFASGGVTSRTSEQLVVQNLSGRRVSVDVRVLGGFPLLDDPRLRGIEVPGNGRTTIDLDRLRRPTLPVELRGSGPIVAQRAVYRIGRPGISIALGVPLPEGARVPQQR